MLGGDGDVQIWTPLRRGGPERRRLPQQALHFPACDKCNNDYSTLESAAKGVVAKLLALQALSAAELEVLLDWIDKIRVGIWLGMWYLEGDPFGVTPNFHISKRIAAKDRALLVYRTTGSPVGWATLATSTPAFHLLPSCFTLIIGSLVLLNISTDFILARAFGLPYPRQIVIDEQGQTSFLLGPGTGYVSGPVLPFRFAPGCSEIYQPVLGAFAGTSFRDDLYVRLFETHGPNAAGHIFIGSIPTPVVGDTLAWIPSGTYPSESRNPIFLRQTLLLQNELLSSYTVHNPRIASDFAESCEFNKFQVASIYRNIVRR